MTQRDRAVLDEPAMKLYTRRMPWVPAALIGILFVAIGLAITHGGPVRGVPGPIIGVGCVVLGALPALLALLGRYYMLTPIPLPFIDASGTSCQTLPLISESVRWEDMQTIRAVKARAPSLHPHRRDAQLSVTITVVRHAASVYGIKRPLLWRLSGADLPETPDAIVRQIRRYHPVSYLDRYEGAKTS